MAENGPIGRTMASAGTEPPGARTPHKEDPCIRRLRGRDDQGLRPGVKIKALEAVGRPGARILYENPNQAR